MYLNNDNDNSWETSVYEPIDFLFNHSDHNFFSYANKERVGKGSEPT